MLSKPWIRKKRKNLHEASQRKQPKCVFQANENEPATSSQSLAISGSFHSFMACFVAVIPHCQQKIHIYPLNGGIPNNNNDVAGACSSSPREGAVTSVCSLVLMVSVSQTSQPQHSSFRNSANLVWPEGRPHNLGVSCKASSLVTMSHTQV